MATNAFSLMMGAARAIMKPIPPPAPAVDHVIQKKLGRPPTAKKTADLIPIAKNLSFNGEEGQARLQYQRREISHGSRSPSSSEGERQKL